ncbi:MAG TPA: formylglycine-generating enzyme family protein [Planctomycetaceae bacterium]|nr:formylglycine-generating enzyme family protein [Planctomycetaceae bacterium]
MTVSGIRLRLIPPGKFQMGSTPDELAILKQLLTAENASEFDRFVSQTSGPRHAVEITRPFYMSQYEVTAAQFQEYTRTPRLDWLPPDGNPAEQPICGVSWEEAKAFCRWLNDNAPPGSEGTFDLPTEAQWEYACRAGTQSLWSFGDDPVALSEYAIVDQKGSRYPAPIGLRRANPFGLWDMHGNVSEWCQDWHIQDFYGRSPLQDPVYDAQPNQSSSGRVVRGGSWNAATWMSRSAMRSYDSPTSPVFAHGFRVVKSIPAARASQ